MKYLILDSEQMPVAVANIAHGEVRQLRASLRAGYSAEKLAADKCAANYGVKEWSKDHAAVAMVFG